MKNQIEKHLEKYNKILKVSTLDQTRARDALKKEVEKILEENKEVKKIASQCENNSKDFQFDYFGEVESWTRVDFSFLEDLGLSADPVLKKLVAEYFLENYHIRLDFENDCALYSLGPNILINHEGDVLDQDFQKWIIKKSEYDSDSELYQLIENWMEKKGYFPSVFRTDYHGSVFLVDTKEERK